MLWSTAKHFVTLPNAFECFGKLWNTSKPFETLWNASESFGTLRNSSKCFLTLRKSLERFETLENSWKYFGMLRNVLGCFEVLQNASKRFESHRNASECFETLQKARSLRFGAFYTGESSSIATYSLVSQGDRLSEKSARLLSSRPFDHLSSRTKDGYSVQETSALLAIIDWKNFLIPRRKFVELSNATGLASYSYFYDVAGTRLSITNLLFFPGLSSSLCPPAYVNVIHRS